MPSMGRPQPLSHKERVEIAEAASASQIINLQAAIIPSMGVRAAIRP
jgi:hypothetical protein